MNKKKSYKPEGKNFLSIVKGLLEKDYEGCKKLEKEDEFELKTIPKEVQSLAAAFADITPSEMPNRLSSLRDIQHYVDLVPNFQGYVNELFENGVFRESKSTFVVLNLLMSKKDSSWRICLDSGQINHIKVKYRFLIPTFQDLLNQLDGARVFLRIDLRSRCQKIRFRP